jgi:hypothetical protein
MDTDAHEFGEKTARDLSGWGFIFPLAGVVAVFASLWVAGTVNNHYSFEGWGANGVSWVWVIAGVAALLLGGFAYMVLLGLAEIIRQLQRSKTG